MFAYLIPIKVPVFAASRALLSCAAFFLMLQAPNAAPADHAVTSSAAEGHGPDVSGVSSDRIRTILQNEARIAGLPPAIADAVVQVESAWNWRVVGELGEIGLMQVRPTTAAMLGFSGTAAELARPRTNIHYGVTYLAQAWRLAHGDLCRTLMKYRAGLGEERMSLRSAVYCMRARSYLAALGSPFAEGTPPAMVESMTHDTRGSASIRAKHAPRLISPVSVYRNFRRGTPAATRAFWKAQAARVRVLNRIVEAKWRHRRLVLR